MLIMLIKKVDEGKEFIWKNKEYKKAKDDKASALFVMHKSFVYTTRIMTFHSPGISFALWGQADHDGYNLALTPPYK